MGGGGEGEDKGGMRGDRKPIHEEGGVGEEGDRGGYSTPYMNRGVMEVWEAHM